VLQRPFASGERRGQDIRWRQVLPQGFEEVDVVVALPGVGRVFPIDWWGRGG
jgi:hypothetical protein